MKRQPITAYCFQRDGRKANTVIMYQRPSRETIAEWKKYGYRLIQLGELTPAVIREAKRLRLWTGNIKDARCRDTEKRFDRAMEALERSTNGGEKA